MAKLEDLEGWRRWDLPTGRNMELPPEDRAYLEVSSLTPGETAQYSLEMNRIGRKIEAAMKALKAAKKSEGQNKAIVKMDAAYDEMVALLASRFRGPFQVDDGDDLTPAILIGKKMDATAYAKVREVIIRGVASGEESVSAP